MIKISISFLDENALITIDSGDISIVSKNKIISELIKSTYYRLSASYSPSDGSIGRLLAKELVDFGGKILEISEPKPEEDFVY